MTRNNRFLLAIALLLIMLVFTVLTFSNFNWFYVTGFVIFAILFLNNISKVK